MRPELILVTTCKPFSGEQGRRQRQALSTWRALGVPVVVCGTDPGALEISREFGFENVPVRTGRSIGVDTAAPLLGDVLAAGRFRSARWVIYANCDLFLFPDFAARLAALGREHGSGAWITGARLDFAAWPGGDPDGQPITPAQLESALAASVAHPPSGVDWFCFERSFYPSIPEFVVGRTAWDSWLMHDALERARPPVDASRRLAVLHQEHEYVELLTEAGQAPSRAADLAAWPTSPATLHNRRAARGQHGSLSDPRWLRA